MRFLALQTDVEALKRGVIVPGEQEIMMTTDHAFEFFSTLVRKSFLLIVYIGLLLAALMLITPSMMVDIILGVLLAFGLLFYGNGILTAYIAWRFNFLIVTTEKVIVIRHKSVWYQTLNSIHLNNLVSTKFESQFYGFVRCGIVHLSLKERDEGSTKEVIVPYIPRPDAVVGAIENARLQLVRQ